MKIEYITLILYLGVLLALGAVFARFNKNLSDFVRGGAQGTWWMVGMSILMSGISAFTFTGNASAAYEAGPSMLIIYVANCAGFAIGGFFLGPWLRQTRAYTAPDVVRARFGTSVEQFSAFVGLFMGPLYAAVQLYALSLFASTVLDMPLIPIMVTIAVIVVFYSTTGGKWAVMATDFVQGLIMYAITILVCYLSLRAVGGVSGFIDHWKTPAIAQSFEFFKEPGAFHGDRFTVKWAIVIFFMQVSGQISLSSASRYISAKDGREASRASWMAFVLMAVGSLLWFIPPMVCRMLYEGEMMATGLDKPSESAYAFIATKLLPNGMLGMLIAAMFAATMSSMDSGLNGQVGSLVRNIIPRLRGALGYNQPLPSKVEVRICHLATLMLGVLIIFYALIIATQDKVALFDVFLLVGSVIGIPMSFPMLVGLWVKKLPCWSYFPIFAGCMLPSVWSFVDESLNDVSWTVQDRTMWIFVFGIGATLVCRFCYRTTSTESREKIGEFFETMHTPVDYEKEIGSSTVDYAQYFVLGKSVMGVGGLILFILFVPNDLAARICILSVALSIIFIGALLHRSGDRVRKRVESLVQKEKS
ncbi:sodium:solute symporter family protein [Cerasicoccus frondis]|uniref:sodium:solute symporter family protein n=1 Tax=Cerasicoccus frondis TaxID=490090 RepID=UPI002852C996|nr:hypothetical protein [Cerasicoccus frondis]